MRTLFRSSADTNAKRLLGIVALIIALFIGIAQSASAAPSGNDSSSGYPAASARTVPGDDIAPSAACPITLYGYTGNRICGFDYSYLDWGGGNVEWFVVGTDYAIWHIWLNSGGWHSLGGKASSLAPNGAYTYADASGVGVATFGTDENVWCRDWPWSSGWYRC